MNLKKLRYMNATVQLISFFQLKASGLIYGSMSLFSKVPLSILNPVILYQFLLYVTIPVLGLIVLLLLWSTLRDRYRYESLIIPKKNVDASVNAFLTEVIFSDYDSNEIRDKVEAFKKEVPFEKKWCKNIILKKIISIKQNMNGHKVDQIITIYKLFGLDDYSIKLIESNKWYMISLGIYHLQVLDYKLKKVYFKPFLETKNPYLKSNVLIASISLSDEQFSFLNDYKEKISAADELKILDIMYQKDICVPEKINNWLLNSNNSVVILALKIMVRCKQPLTLPQIERLLSSPDKSVRKEAMVTIRDLKITAANDILMRSYVMETDKRNKLSILKTIAVLGTETNKVFCTDLLLDEKDLDLKFEIARSIDTIDKTYFKNFKISDKKESDIIERIVLHLNNPLLN